MKIILEKVIKGARVTGVAKIMNGEVNVNNVPFDVSSKEELDIFCLNLLKIQADFATVADGEYTPKAIVKEVDPVQEALNAVYNGKSQLEAKIITEEEYNQLVVNYKTLTSGEVIKK